MKRLLIILFLCITVQAQYTGIKSMLGRQVDYSHHLSRGLVGQWLMNEGSGDTVQDLSGNGHTGTLENGVAWTAGGFGPATYFDGADDRINCGNAYSLSQAITLIAWINTSGTTDDYPRIIGSDGDWSILLDPDDGKLRWYGSGSDDPFADSPDLRDGKWHQVAATWEASRGDNPWGYVDGVLVGKTDQTNVLDNNTTVYIGDRADSGRSFIGYVDNASIHDRALSSSEMQQLYKEPFCIFKEGLPVAMMYVDAGAPPAVVVTPYYYRGLLLFPLIPFGFYYWRRRCAV